MINFLKNIDHTKYKTCEFGVVDEACYFCEHPLTIIFNEHYTFCPSCATIYTTMIIQKSNCDHIKDGVPCLDSPIKIANHVCSGYIHLYSPDFEKPFIWEDYKDIYEGGDGVVQRCSKCHAECIADGW